MPWEIRNICETVKRECKVPLGIHVHNDSGMAVVNSLVALDTGVVQVQGTINGIGERCGNANLCSILPNLELKKRRALGEKHLARLREVSHFVTEIANLMPDKHQPYVGDSAFAHKGGVHIHAVLKNPATYEHVDPAQVGKSTACLGLRLRRPQRSLGQDRSLRNQALEGPLQGARAGQYAQRAGEHPAWLAKYTLTSPARRCN